MTSPAPPAITIRHGIPDPLAAEAVALYWQAFGQKLGPVMGPAGKAHEFLNRVMNRRNAFVALDGAGRLLGFGGYRTDHGSFAGGTVADLRAVYGPAGAAWRAALLQRLSTSHDDDRFLIDGICVAEEARGRGIGTALVRALLDEARLRGHGSARLEVVDSNRRARQLYERLGFVAERDHRIGLLRIVFGFSVATTMIRPLTTT